MTVLAETATEVAALIPRHAWLLMDEDQRDTLMQDVVLPRYMATTTDGVALGPTWWARAVGATYDAIESRVRRLRQSQIPAEERAAGRLTEQRGQRAARQVLREADPETVERIVGDLPPERQALIAESLSSVEPHVPHIHPTHQGWLPSKLLADAVMSAYRAWSKMQDETPPDDAIRERCLANADRLSRYAAGIEKLLMTGDIDAELQALVQGVGDE